MMKSPHSPDSLMKFLSDHDISFDLHGHQPVFTVEESRAVNAHIGGGHSKNLFLKDKKGNLALFSAHKDTKVDLKYLAKQLGMGRLSFGKPELLFDHLGVRPGSVCAYAIINDPTHKVQFAYDSAFENYSHVNFHPLENDKTLSVPLGDFKKFITLMNRPVVAITPFDQESAE